MKVRHLVFPFAAIVLGGASASAQWLNHPTPGIPRTSEGKPNLSAPAPRGPDGKPDLSGLWRIGPGAGYENNIVADLKPGEVQPWVQALYRERVENFVVDDPVVPISPTIFAPPTGGSYEFVVDAQGVVTGMRLHGVSGMRTAARTK